MSKRGKEGKKGEGERGRSSSFVLREGEYVRDLLIFIDGRARVRT